MEKSMSEELKGLIDKLSQALGDTIQQSQKLSAILKEIEEGGYDASITMAVILGLKNRNTEIRQIIYGPEKNQVKKSTARRISAFDKRFLRALRIELLD
jgi:predicted nucleotidyltransferase